jgi:hypothetical protein
MKTQITITLDLPTVGRYALALLLLWAALSKLAAPTEFLGSLYAYQLPLPKPLLQLVAMALPWFEFLCALLLLLNLWADSSLIAVCALLILFLAATGQAWARGLHISCGCFNLKFLGLDRGHPVVELFDSVGFAFLRNLVISGIALLLLRRRLTDYTGVARGGSLSTASMPLGQRH